MMIKQLYLEILCSYQAASGLGRETNCMVVLSASYHNREIRWSPSLQKQGDGVLEPQIKSMESTLEP